jgi:beta-1,4-mannosyl-glycoprotein beta-1,4-N-acetylglucosaminyltransferase
MIYDCFLFANEKECLKIRCEELKEMNITHVLVEATTSFTGNKKELEFDKIKIDFEKYNIIHIIVDDLPNNGDTWENEAFQRNAIMRGLRKCKDDDIVIISDADEIPNKHTIKKYHAAMKYNELAIIHHKEFAQLNIIPNE